MSDQAKNPGREVSRQTLAAGRVLNLQAIRWRDATGTERVWEMAARNGDHRAVLLIAWLQPSDRLVLVSQYRPPANGTVIEFPAGLIDGSETPDEAARRELHEETGYRGRVVRCFPASYNTPGLSSERTHVVMVEIDETSVENRNAAPRPQDEEEIEVVLVGRGQIANFLTQSEAAGVQFDSKVIAYLTALVSDPDSVSAQR
jgi:8-oxo-dGTP pyrophosphatase MutT (NUDIX family)